MAFSEIFWAISVCEVMHGRGYKNSRWVLKYSSLCIIFYKHCLNMKTSYKVSTALIFIIALVSFYASLRWTYLYKRHVVETPDLIIKPSQQKGKIRLFVAVLSAGIRYPRRKASRETWMKYCEPPYTICRFFTDGLGLEPKLKETLEKENATFQDLVFLPTSPGLKFGFAFFHFLKWFKENNTDVEFDYLLRVDDDHFVCLDRLNKELVHRPRDNLYWGWFHCVDKMIRADAGFILFSMNLINNFYERRKTLLCSEEMGQQTMLWLRGIPNVTYVHDNSRIYHDVSAHNKNLKLRSEVCHTFLSLHGSYPNEMYAFWSIVEKEPDRIYDITDIVPFRKKCAATPGFEWEKFKGTGFYHIPQSCSNTSYWVDNIGSVFVGRSGSLEE